MIKRDILDEKILKKIRLKTDLSEGHIRNEISKIKAKYSKTTQNGCAQLWCERKQGFSIRNLLSREDRESLPQENSTNQIISLTKRVYPKQKDIKEKQKMKFSDLEGIIAISFIVLSYLTSLIGKIWQGWEKWSWISDIIFIISFIFLLVIYFRRRK